MAQRGEQRTTDEDVVVPLLYEKTDSSTGRPSPTAPGLQQEVASPSTRTSSKDEEAAAARAMRGVKYVLLFNTLNNAAFYGFSAISAAYFNSFLGVDERFSDVITNIAVALNFGSGVLGAHAADAWWDHYKVLILGVGLSTLSMALFTASRLLVLWGVTDGQLPITLFCLALFDIGIGAARPSSSVFLGNQLTQGDEEMRERYYSWYYLSVQVGGILSTVSIPVALEYAGHLAPLWVFAAMLVLLLFGWGLFVWNADLYNRTIRTEAPPFFGVVGEAMAHPCAALPPTDSGDRSTTTYYGAIGRPLRHAASGSPAPALEDTPSSERGGTTPESVGRLAFALKEHGGSFSRPQVESVADALKVLWLFLPIPFFWAIFFQIFSVWQFQAKAMNREVFGWTIPFSDASALDNIFDILMIPVFSTLVYPWLRGRGFAVTPIQKIVAGHVFACLSLATSAVVQLVMRSHTLHVAWICPQMFLLSCAEITLSVTAYELAYSEAPEAMKGTVTACWLLTIAAGNLGTSILAVLPLTDYVMSFTLAGLALVVGVVFWRMASGFVYKNSAA